VYSVTLGRDCRIALPDRVRNVLAIADDQIDVDVDPLRTVFADHMHRAAAARAGGIFRFDDNLNPRQVLGQRAPPGAPVFRAGLAQRRIGFVLFGLARGNCLFEIFQSQVELIGIELLRRQ